MQKQIEEFLDVKKQLAEQLKVWVKDKSIPLDQRWELFVKSELGEKSNWIERFEGIDSDLYYDEFYIHKYQTTTVDYLYECACENDILVTDEDKEAFKEDVLDQFIFSFKFDW